MKKYQDLLKLKPTQFAIGVAEVHEKVAEMAKMKKKELDKLIRKTPIPVVRSPEKELYVVDHHHFLFCCYQIGVKKVRVEVIDDLSDRTMTVTKFWTWMKKHNSFYPYCQFGEGPRNSLYLPQDIRGLADDPYRSLAWFVRKAGAYNNSDKPFAEFKWANYFRSKQLLHRKGRTGFDDAVKKAVKLAKHDAAKKLPGYIRPTAKQKAKIQAELKDHPSRKRDFKKLKDQK